MLMVMFDISKFSHVCTSCLCETLYPLLLFYDNIFCLMLQKYNSKSNSIHENNSK